MNYRVVLNVLGTVVKFLGISLASAHQRLRLVMWVLSSQVGPMANFGSLHVIGKLVLILNMLIGRLEVMTVLVLFVPSFWKK